jgi:hypothetical protein
VQPFPNKTLHVIDNVLTTIQLKESNLTWHHEMNMTSFTGADVKDSFNVLDEVKVCPIWETIDVVDDRDDNAAGHKSVPQPSYNSCFQGF